MVPAAASFNVEWCLPDGSRVPIEPTGVRVDVASEVHIGVGIEPRGAARLAVTLTLSDGRRFREETAGASARFVVIPLDRASFLVAVAEPSDDPVNLMPVPSSPTWTLSGDPMPSHGWLTARRVEGVALECKVVPGPGDLSVCALEVSAMPPTGARFTNTREPGSAGSVRFSVPRLSPQLLTLECEWEFHGPGGTPPSWP